MKNIAEKVSSCVQKLEFVTILQILINLHWGGISRSVIPQVDPSNNPLPGLVVSDDLHPLCFNLRRNWSSFRMKQVQEKEIPHQLVNSTPLEKPGPDSSAHTGPHIQSGPATAG